jgi:hypothetical protein
MVIASLKKAVFATAMAAVTYKTEDLGIASTTLAGLAVGGIELVTIVITGLVAPPTTLVLLRASLAPQGWYLVLSQVKMAFHRSG